MRIRRLAIVAVNTVFWIGALGAGATQSMAAIGSHGARILADAVDPVEKAGCWRYGWHGWGWCPVCGPPPPPYAWGWAPGCRDVTIRERHPDGTTEVRHIHRCY